MKKHSLNVEAPHFLTGWKEIASFLRKGVRTVQRYEREMGLPVRRPAGKVRGSVVAVRAELEGWVKAVPIREAFQLRNTQQDSQHPTAALHKSVSELAALREQMSTLRAELHNSVERIHDSLTLIRAELVQEAANQSRSKYPSSIYSPDKHELLDRAAAPAAIKFPQAS
ncbi:MAG TPA: hypothetical protein VFO39_21765 [Candidatus Sulfotelmatobacter sp.]|nr:hypothetical protein [Candidatus Sulfotelmatobacter sp.]